MASYAITLQSPDGTENTFDCNEDTYILEHGDVLIFDGHSQMKSTHAVPDIVEAEERINLTFRTGL